ncbi:MULTISPECIES: response regulator [Protofrankia]|uniref:Transcriptional regulator n=1 Tax=Protofrankia coriariae TaxID=1562887 RepID=A0ABR5F6P8_9ACTN|nr:MULTISPECIES: response regulator [Protofrankia]KLL12343.1 transcriptional regulator [Protofrankia coriariae]ONH37351.1 DNA-binding response regulator [Protofrankia sp. BMG5.30]
MTRVLIVDDDTQILRALRITLHARGYEVMTATSGRHALAATTSGRPDIILLDLGLPDMDGAEVIHALRSWTTTPVIVLSGRAGSTDKVGALDAGADDYVTKPFRVDELLARLRAVARRTLSATEAPLTTIGDYTIDLTARRITRLADHRRDRASAAPEPAPRATRPAGKARETADPEPPANHADRPEGLATVRLSPTEWHLLEVLVRNPGKLLTHRQLLPRTGGPSPKEHSHYLREYMGRLRRKLEPNPARPRHFITEPGMGYRFQP